MNDVRKYSQIKQQWIFGTIYKYTFQEILLKHLSKIIANLCLFFLRKCFVKYWSHIRNLNWKLMSIGSIPEISALRFQPAEWT